MVRDKLRDLSKSIDAAKAATPVDVHLKRVNEVRDLIDDSEAGFEASAKIKAALDSIIQGTAFWHNKRWLAVALKGLAGGFILNLDSFQIERKDDWESVTPSMSDYNRRLSRPE